MSSATTIPRLVGVEGVEDPEVVRAFTRLSGLPPSRLMRRYIARRIAALNPRGLCVDMGCGPGLLLRRIAQENPTLRLIGVDLSEEMIRLASEYPKNLPQLEFRLGDAKRLPLEDDTVDCLVSTLSLHHWLDPQQVFSEVYRVLRPGGHFVLFDLRRDVAAGYVTFVAFVQRFLMPDAMRRHNEPTTSLRSSYTLDELSEMLVASPFPQHRLSRGPVWMLACAKKL